MKLIERRNFQVINCIRNVILNSEKDIGVRIEGAEFKDVAKEYSDEEVMFALRYLKGKDYLEPFTKGSADFTLTSKGYDEWLFPNGPINEKGIFVSYATEDKALAGKLKDVLEREGLRIFLAHEDIEPTAKWRDRIISDLKSCNIFIALRSEAYSTKQYTEQECGFALALNKRILSLCIGTKATDMGFCSEFQGQVFGKKEENKIFDYCKKQLGSMIKEIT
jgi:hypothetical protein